MAFRRFGSGAAGSVSPSSPVSSLYFYSLPISLLTPTPVPTGWGHIVLGLRGPVCTSTKTPKTQIQ